MSNTKEKPKGAVLYGLGSMSQACSYTILANLTYALTESFSMSAKVVGLIFLFSRFFDGFTDLIAGFLIDKTNSKLGKARPYEIMYIPLWITMVLCFSVPRGFSDIGKSIWVFVMYNACQSICYTFAASIQSVRLRRSFKESIRVKVITISTIMVTVASAIAGIMTPILISLFEERPNGWTIIITIYAVPFMIGGILRFLLLKEMDEELPDYTGEKKVTLKKAFGAMRQNKYAWIIAIVALLIAIGNNINSSIGNYYFKYVMGDVKYATIPGLFVLCGMGLVVFMPKLSQKFGTQKTIIIGFSIALIGYMIRFFAETNMIMIVLGMVLASVGVVYAGSMKDIGLTETMTYGEWKTGETYEGIYASLTGLADKLGLGLGSVILGFVLDFGGYNGDLAIQSESAILSIRMLFGMLPAVIMLVGIMVTIAYTLPGKLKEYEAEIQARKGR